MRILKVLVFADFPSPYRVEVLKGLKNEYDLTVFFDKISDQNRNSEWFCKKDDLDSYSLLESEGQKIFQAALHNLSDYDLVIAYDYHIINAIKLELICIKKHVPYIMNVDGAFIRKNPIKNAVKRFLIMHASGFFAGGIHAAEYLLHFGAQKNNIYFHPFTSLHASDIYDKPASIDEKKQLRIELGIKDMKTIVSVGQFIPRKGFDVLLNAWGKLDIENQLLIIGGGDEQIKYESIIRKRGYNNVSLVGFRPRDIVFKYYRAADIFVFPTHEDIWGLVINEAMACGLPVIASNMCLGAVELIEQEKNGIIFEDKDETTVYDAVLKCLNMNLYEIGYNNIKKIQEYTYENVIKSHIHSIDLVHKNSGQK